MTARLFVAAWPPPEALEQVAALPRPDLPGVRWTRREQWHVTLLFLGQAEPDEATTALDRVSAAPAGARMGPKVSRLGRAVVCLPVAGLDEVAAAVRSAFAATEERPFRGHLTLARVDGRIPRGLLGAPFAATFPVDEVSLVRSTLGRGPAHYETIATCGLG